MQQKQPLKVCAGVWYPPGRSGALFCSLLARVQLQDLLAWHPSHSFSTWHTSNKSKTANSQENRKYWVKRAFTLDKEFTWNPWNMPKHFHVIPHSSTVEHVEQVVKICQNCVILQISESVNLHIILRCEIEGWIAAKLHIWWCLRHFSWKVQPLLLPLGYWLRMEICPNMCKMSEHAQTTIMAAS